MGYDEKLAERVRQSLSGRPDVVERRMMGGLSFMVNGRMCCRLSSAGFMVRVGKDAREGTLAQTHVRPTEIAGRRLAGFVDVDPGDYGTDAKLAKCVQRGVDFVATLPVGSPAARRAKPKARRM
jgi:hypothetical protein